MPPDGYTTVTISTETAAKLSEVMMRHDLESMALSIAYAADCRYFPNGSRECYLLGTK
jgi:hypothetical protein